MKFTAVVHDNIQETPRVKRLLLSAPEIKDLKFRPGQWVGIASEQLKDGTRLVRKAFSIASSPDENFLELCVAKGKNLSAHLQDLTKGAKLYVDGPYGNFWLKPAEKYLFIAGGTGIAPLRPMIKQALQEGKEVILLFSFKTSADFIYHRELETLKGKFILVPTITQQDPHWNGETGRAQTILHKYWTRGFACYICGPPSMVEEVQKKLHELGQSKETIFVEKWE